MDSISPFPGQKSQKESIHDSWGVGICPALTNLNVGPGHVADLLDLDAVLADDGAALGARHGQPDEQLLLAAQALQEVPQFPADEAEGLEDHLEGAGDGQDLLVPALGVGEQQVGAGLGWVGFSDTLCRLLYKVTQLLVDWVLSVSLSA